LINKYKYFLVVFYPIFGQDPYSLVMLDPDPDSLDPDPDSLKSGSGSIGFQIRNDLEKKLYTELNIPGSQY
jgi:hypothetical protein